MTDATLCDPAGPAPTPSRRASAAIAIATVVAAAGAMVTLGVAAPDLNDPVPHVALRAALVYPAWLLLPGLPWVALIHGRKGKTICPVLALATAVGISILVQALNLAVLKLAGWSPHPLTFMGIIGAEALISLPLLMLVPPLSFQRPSWREASAIAVALVVLLAFGLWRAPQGTRRLACYWYHPAIEEGWDASDVPVKLHGPWGKSATVGHGDDEVRRYKPTGNAFSMVAEGEGTTTVAMLLQAEIGATLTVRHFHHELGRDTIETHPVEVEREGPVLRYTERGIASVIAPVELSPGDRLDVQVDASAGFTVYDMTGSSVEAVWTSQAFGLHDVHYYQILNIAENVEWARELLTSRFLTLHQPPLWSYFHAGSSLLNGPDLPAAYFVFLLILAGLAVVGIRLIVSLEEHAPFPALLLPLAGALCHGEHVIRHSEPNFPDNLFALAVMVGMLGLARREAGFFGGAGVMTSILRYPGFAVLSVAAVLDGLLRRDRRGMLRNLAAMWIPLAAFCTVMLLVGAVTGRLGHWLWILHFETFPEHYHGDYALSSLLPRVPRFFADLLVYAGWLPLFALPVLGRGARLLFGVGLIYCFVLCAIDHFPIHYFLPLIALFAAAAGCNAVALGKRLGGWATHAVAWPALALALGYTFTV